MAHPPHDHSSHGHSHDPHHGHGHSHHHADPAEAVRPFSDPAQESLSQALRFGFNILGVIMAVLLAAFLASGLFQVNPGEQGLIVRFGKLVQNESSDERFGGTFVFGPGWHLSWPEPIDAKIPVSGEAFRLTIDTFLFRRTDENAGKPLAEAVPSANKLTPGVHGTMLSGDRNLSHGQWTVEYRIEDAEKFVRRVGESPAYFQHMLRCVTENAVVRVVAGLPVERIMLRDAEVGGAGFVSDVQREVNEELIALETGVIATKITAETVEPGVVRRAFLEVTQAQNERQRSINEARQNAARTLNEAAGRAFPALLEAIEAYGAAQATDAPAQRLSELRAEIDASLDGAAGAVATRLSEAQSRANEIRERVAQEYDAFTHYLSAARQAPRLTLVRLWVRMRDAILSSKQNEIFAVPDSQEIEILTNRDPQRLIEAEMERYDKRYESQQNRP